MVFLLGFPVGVVIVGITMIRTATPSRQIGWLLIAYAVMWIPTGVAADLFADGVLGVQYFVLARAIVATILLVVGYLVYTDRNPTSQYRPEITDGLMR